MDLKKLRLKTADELSQYLLDLLRERFNLRMQKGMDEVVQPHLHKRVRRNIAKVKTLIREKEMRE